MVLESTSPQETFALGAAIGELLQLGDVLNLVGDLGAGKTYLVKGIASSLGILPEEVTSPTFTLINEYQGKLPVYHFDVYRLEAPAQMEDLGYEEYFYGRGISVVEWGDQVIEYLPDHYLTIQLEKIGEQARTIHLIPHGERYERLVARLQDGVKQ